MIWTAAIAVLLLRPLVAVHRGTSFDTYNLAGQHWIHGENIYSQWMGFVYSPSAAVFFALFASMPPLIGNILWRLLNTVVLLAGVAAVLNANLFREIKKNNYGIVYLLLLPLAIGNIDISQANPLVEGLLLLAIAAVCVERWNSAALCIAVATCLKIYPIAVGLLICLIAPGKFGWRLLLALVLVAIVPFFFQNWSFVADQYRSWIATRAAEDRRQWPIEKLPLDVWFLIHRVGNLPVSSKMYSLIQSATGTAIALFCIRSRTAWPRKRGLTGLFCLGSIWMTLCGPATESYTYLILAPATILALVQSFDARHPIGLRAFVSMAFTLQLLSVLRSSFLPHFKSFFALSIQPISALVFLVYALWWLCDETLWRAETQNEWQPGRCKPHT